MDADKVVLLFMSRQERLIELLEKKIEVLYSYIEIQPEDTLTPKRMREDLWEIVAEITTLKELSRRQKDG